MSDEAVEFNPALVMFRIETLAKDLHKVNESLVMLVTLSERQTALLDKLTHVGGLVEDHEARIRVLERVTPEVAGALEQAKETRSWVVGGVAAALSSLATVVGTYLFGRGGN